MQRSKNAGLLFAQTYDGLPDAGSMAFMGDSGLRGNQQPFAFRLRVA